MNQTRSSGTEPRQGQHGHAHGLTLLEMMLSMVILSILLVGAQSAIVIAAKALPDGRSPASRIVAASNLLDLLNGELAYATSFSDMTSKVVAFTVADRNKDGQPETIRYAWSGIAGAPLTRQYNGGAPVVVAASVQNFQLAYDKKATPLAATFSEGSEALLDSFNSSSSLNDASVTSSNWRAQIFTPSLPPSTVSWRVTRIFIRVRKEGSNSGTTQIQLRPVVGGVPSNTVLAEQSLLENTLTSGYQWREFSFADSGSFGASASLCLVLKWVSGNESCRVQFRNNLLSSPSNYMLSGIDSNWNSSNNSVLYYVYGAATTPNPPTYSYKLTSIRCLFQSASDASSQLNGTVQILNQPQVPGP